MIRLAIAFFIITAVTANTDKVTTSDQHESALFIRIMKFGVFVLGIITALIQIVFYAKSFKTQNVVTFEVFGGTHQTANNKPLGVAGESDRVIGTGHHFHKSQEEIVNPDPIPNANKDIENIAKDMFKEAQESLSARDRRKRKAHNINANKSQDKNQNTF